MEQEENLTEDVLSINVDFRKSPYLQLAKHATGFLGTFMLTLAAYQRGLQVSFLFDTERVQSDDPDYGVVQVGRSFAISDSQRTYRFSSTAGFFTTEYAKIVSYRKDTQKFIYNELGLPTPSGVLSSKETLSNDLIDLSNKGIVRFVIKPVDGSLARDTFVNKTEEEIRVLALKYPHEKFMLEEFVVGPEYRFTVVNDNCVAVFERKPPFIIGDGKSTVLELVNQKNQSRKNNPFLSSKPIDLVKLTSTEQIEDLCRHVPDLGAFLFLSDLQRVGVGGEPWDVSKEMPQVFKDMAILACRGIKAKNVGVDIIIGSLEDEKSARILEANVRHHIEGHSFCENNKVWDNRIADSIIDMYFPDSMSSGRDQKAVFDHFKVRRALQTQCFSGLHLPKLHADWVTWHFKIGTTPEHKSIRRAILPETAKLGLYVTEVMEDDGSICLVITGPAKVYEVFLNRTGIIRSLVLADEIVSLLGDEKTNLNVIS